MRAAALLSLVLSRMPSPSSPPAPPAPPLPPSSSSSSPSSSPPSSPISSPPPPPLILLPPLVFFLLPPPPPLMTPPPKRRATSPAALALRLARAASSDADLADALIPESAASRLRIRSTAAVADAEEEEAGEDLLSSMMEVVIFIYLLTPDPLPLGELGCRRRWPPAMAVAGLCFCHYLQEDTVLGLKGG